jgi:hypothetical protein
MKKILPFLPFIILGISTWLTLTNSWIVPSINEWQAGMMGDKKYFPALTIFILALPPLLVLLLVKKWMDKKKV